MFEGKIMPKPEQQTMSDEAAALLFSPNDRINMGYDEQFGFFIPLGEAHEWSHYIENQKDYDFDRTLRKDLLMYIFHRCKYHTASSEYHYNTDGEEDWAGFPECIDMLIAILSHNMEWTGAMLNMGSRRFQDVLSQIMKLPREVVIPEMRAFIDILLMQADAIEFNIRYGKKVV